METKKLGFLVMGLSIILGFAMFSYMGQLNAQGQQMQCNPTQECRQVSSMLGVSHVAVGFLSFIFALGFYLLFFNRSEKEILANSGLLQKNAAMQNENSDGIALNSNENAENNIDKFGLLLRPLDESQKKILISIKEQQGITQSTLRFRANLSKAKVSQILTDFERKNLIERKSKGKTYQVFLTDNYDN